MSKEEKAGGKGKGIRAKRIVVQATNRQSFSIRRERERDR